MMCSSPRSLPPAPTRAVSYSLTHLKQLEAESIHIIREVAAELNLSSHAMPSGAAHDTQKLARLTAAGMIFVPSKEGRSHSAAEWTAWSDIEAGANPRDIKFLLAEEIITRFHDAAAAEAAPSVATEKAESPAPAAPVKDGNRIFATPLARRIAADKGLDLTAIKGSAELTMPESLAKAMVMPQIQRDLALLQQEGKLSREEAANLSPDTLNQIAEQAYPGYLSGSGFGRWFVRDNNGFKFSLSVNRGQVVVNGVPMTGAGR